MFDQTFVNAHAQTRRPWTVALSLALQTMLVAILLIAPLLRIASLDLHPKLQVWLPIQKVDLKVAPEAAHAAPRGVRSVFRAPRLAGYTPIPKQIDLSPDAPGIANAVGIAGPANPVFGAINTLPPPPRNPVVTTPPAPSAPVRVGGGVQAAKLLFGPKPPYPPLARAARVQGTVRLQAVIARDGSIANPQVLSGPALLIAVATEAVRQWRYQPTHLNGEAVEVVTEIAITFTLSQ